MPKTRTRPRKNTKSYKEFQRLFKNLAEQSRYYRKLGVDLPDVKDAFRRSDASYKNLQALKKFRTAYKARVKQVKKDVATIRSTLGVDTSTAYKIYSRDYTRETGPLRMEDVVIANFKYQVSSMPNLDARQKLTAFINEYEKTFEDQRELANVLQETAEEDRAFEALQSYLKSDELAFNLNELMSALTNRLTGSPITQAYLNDIIDTLL